MKPATTQLRVLIAFIVSSSFFHSSAQYTVAGPLSGSTFANDNSIGNFPFSIPGNAVASDNNRSSANALLILLNGNTHYLKVTGFGFSVPSLATVTGIKVEIEKSAWDISILATVRDNEIKLVKDGSVVGNNKASGSSWTDTDNYNTYGDTTDDWGETWMPEDINSPDFGVVFSAKINGLVSLIPSARVDHIRVTVFYIVALPIHFIDFTVTRQRDNNVLLKWVMGDNDEKVTFTVQRSTDCLNWSDLKTLQGSLSPTIRSYEYADKITLDKPRFYYRIKMIKLSGRSVYSKIVFVDFDPTGVLHVYPNPASSEVYISYSAEDDLQIFSMSGKKVNAGIEKIDNRKLKINTACFSKGVYIIRVGNKQSQLLVQ